MGKQRRHAKQASMWVATQDLLEANAALRSIVRRDTGESYQDDDWTHPHDPDAKITKMRDGRTHRAHKAEHAVDLETGAIVGITVQDADEGGTTTSIETRKEEDFVRAHGGECRLAPKFGGHIGDVGLWLNTPEW